MVNLVLIRLASDDFQENMTQMKFDWEGLKKKFIWFEKAEDKWEFIFL